MEDAKELLKSGHLAAAIQQVTQELKSKPMDVSARIFLFELLCFDGDLDRAEKQLDVVSHQSSEMQVGAGIYRQVLAAEKARRAVFNEGRLPDFLTNPPDYVTLHLEALTQARENQATRARALLKKALDLHPALSGKADEHSFEEFEDSDLFLGPFLELIVNDKYVWLPFEEIRRIELLKPAQLRDLLWARAKIEAKGGDLGDVFLPVLYPGTSENANEAAKLGRRTDWLEIGDGLTRGIGQRLFLFDGQELPMLQITILEFANAHERTA